jgi:maltose alpha-D-glucosyltransferase/alpha-amylase
MRLNLGIRRRLAPLFDRDPRQIELAYSLLLTLPGSPIIYYGDEIGLGDNIALPDRNGVRTPMQWNDGANAGFSTAPADRLYAPVIDDYPRVNVAAQQADPASLLNWLKHALQIRRQHPAFGLGTLQLLSPDNTAVLAYARHYEHETLIIVNNLSAAAQALRLDLPGDDSQGLVDLFNPTGSVRSPQVSLQSFDFRWYKLAPLK